MKRPTPPAEGAESVFSLSFRGALPDILRAIATEIETGTATAEHFTSRVSRGQFELTVVINLGKM